MNYANLYRDSFAARAMPLALSLFACHSKPVLPRESSGQKACADSRIKRPFEPNERPKYVRQKALVHAAQALVSRIK